VLEETGMLANSMAASCPFGKSIFDHLVLLCVPPSVLSNMGVCWLY
jgi:hypothetical protein